jgi:hypothetical protein
MHDGHDGTMNTMKPGFEFIVSFVPIVAIVIGCRDPIW